MNANFKKNCKPTITKRYRQKKYKKVFKEIVFQIQYNTVYSNNFFFPKKKSKQENISKIRKHIQYEIKNKFNIVLDEDTISTVIFEHLWSSGTWKVLKMYNYKSSFFHWLKIVSSHAILKYLEEDGYIRSNPAKTPANTRLTLKKYNSEYCKMVIDEMVSVKHMHDFLTAIYVDRLSKKQIMDMFSMDEEEYDQALKSYEYSLKRMLLETVNCFDDAITEKAAPKTLVSSEFLTQIGQSEEMASEDSPLRFIFGAGNEVDLQQNITDFFLECAEFIFTSDIDKYVWSERFIKNRPPVELAEEIGRTRGWVDCKYSRLQMKFVKEIKNWWKKRF